MVLDISPQPFPFSVGVATLEAMKVELIGLNCSTGPEHMREPVRFLAEHATRPVSVIPNAGLPLNTGTGDAVYPLEPAPMAAMLVAQVALGVVTVLTAAHLHVAITHQVGAILLWVLIIRARHLAQYPVAGSIREGTA